ncbi:MULTISPECIES: F0F1 ATP synthase subunit B [Streptomyces]|uniref:ATP synthase subunit b n=1 Tax=Streptomyces morookaense TaxID=1970 RepID=A0A7Y7E7B6_STRMO|nr:MULTISPECIES: F0F1 ATP synthase subunit B [Streptomyces]MCC2279296.1 F0F1 ATP synthase subunit B [Streptomyces sp. ET3-23]NVK78209.1 F0F1 ATP synthase subunit B [Streptomyces morookaense]GHF31376.1 ATP synthase subunit b [Streptomyces morookaense]
MAMNFALDIGPLKPEPAPLVLGLVLFFLVFALMAKVILPRINKVLAEREQATDGRFEEAEETRAEAARVHEEYQALLAEARHEAARLRQESLEQGNAIIAELRAEGQRQREEIIAAGHAVIDAERAVAEAELREQVGVLATQLAGKVVGEPVEDFARESGIVDRFMAELRTAKAADAEARD